MPERGIAKRPRRWGAVSIALLILGLLIALPSGLCVGGAVYDLYLHPTAGDTNGRAVAQIVMVFTLVFAGVILAVGLLSIYAAFLSRIDADDE